MSTVTESSFIKSGSDNIVVLFGADGDAQDDIAVATYIPFSNSNYERGGHEMNNDAAGAINYEPYMRTFSDVNEDGQINIVDDWHVNSIIDGMKSMSRVKDDVAAKFVKEGQLCKFNFQVEVNGSDKPHVVMNQRYGYYLMVPIPLSLFPKYKVTEVSREQLLALAYI
ncbi:MAG: hypothetical protein EZS28_013449 [Streblomastix strix]|uniref:Uncharacterized protein n=1 Tax=Streblomastix strix TaxID=222440 RepID=A0A5J4W945_9EUKA|nr:MAG: hypothetical protein EZS28_013449 [Streblomastix strix]